MGIVLSRKSGGGSSSGGAPSGPAGGDLTGTYPNPTISTSTISAFGRTLVDDATAAAARTTLGITASSVSYAGYNTIGGTTGAMVADKHYLKKITLAAGSTILAIGCYVKQNTTSNVSAMRAGVYLDSTNSPGDIVAESGVLNLFVQNAAAPATGNARWLDIPVVFTSSAGQDVWIGVASHLATLDIYNDGSGSDVVWTATGDYMSDGGTLFAKSVTAFKYSIRAAVLG